LTSGLIIRIMIYYSGCLMFGAESELIGSP
jgi:hypothetical protein